ncbi:DUF433 domain-containing protein [Acetomicrobium thermoterrenum]|uniref:DUF433 domain-containing protein n=1 Tax=Acetomicrobium thermoterrenum TaxID=1120986 RepID=UPI000B82472A|nr:DUF433 domain-containing protein [Acetomicrobium thermoterrenum]
MVAGPKICFGKPVIEGTRIPIHLVLELLGDGVTPDEIIKNYYPCLTKEDILACIRFANSFIMIDPC